MAKRLGDLELPASLEWVDRDDWSPVAQDAQPTLGGGLVVFSQRLTAGRPITLEARDRVCWLSRAEVEALEAMAAVAGAVYGLEWDADPLRQVVFRHHGAPAIEFEPLFPHGDLFVGRVALTEV